MSEGADQERTMLTRELGRRRVFLFVAVWGVISTIGLILEEMDQFNHVLDDYVLLVIVILVLLILVIRWKDRALAQLRSQHSWMAVLFAIALVFKIYAFTQEMGDPADFGDEIPIAILLVLSILNRFL